VVQRAGWALPRPFYLYSQFFLRIKKVQVADALIQMATVLEECNTEEQRYVVCLYGQRDSMQRIFIKKCFPFMVGSVCRVKRFRTLSINSLKDVFKFADDARIEAESG
jgi:hypothetical protein